MTILNVKWLTNRKTLGFVKAQDNVTGEIKYYIGVANGLDEDQDAKDIVNWGTKFQNKEAFDNYLDSIKKI